MEKQCGWHNVLHSESRVFLMRTEIDNMFKFIPELAGKQWACIAVPFDSIVPKSQLKTMNFWNQEFPTMALHIEMQGY